MNSEALQSLCMLAMLAGFVFLGVGGWGTVYFGRQVSMEKEIGKAKRDAELSSKLSVLQKNDDEIRRRLTTFETAARKPVESKPAIEFAGVSREVKPPPAVREPEPPPIAERIESKTEPTKKKPWEMDSKQRRELVKVLRAHAGKSITIKSILCDAESHRLAEALLEAFKDAGWHIKGMDQVLYAPPRFGLCLSAASSSSPEELEASYRALTSAGLEVSQQIDPHQFHDRAVLIVGSIAAK